MSKQIIESVMSDMRAARGLERDDTSDDDDILNLTPAEQFQLYCQWNGLLGWSDTLLRVVSNLFEVKL